MLSNNEVENNHRDEEAVPVGIGEASLIHPDHSEGSCLELRCQNCIANLHRYSPNDDDGEQDGPSLSAPAASLCEAPEFDEDGHSKTTLSDHTPEKEAAHDQREPASPKAMVAKWVLGLGENGYKGMASTLYKNEDIESKPSRNVRAVKWALGTAEKGCKGVAEVFRKKEEAIDLPPKEWAEAAPARSDSLVNNMVRPPLNDDVEPDMEHCLRCIPEKGNRGRGTTNDGCHSAKSDSGDVWAYIAADVENTGITIDLVKKSQNAIAQRVIKTWDGRLNERRRKHLI